MAQTADIASTSTTSPNDLLASLEKHNAAFTKLLSLIPSRYYLPVDQDELDSKWMKNKKRKTGEEIKEHKRRAKAEKLDPANNLTTDQILAQASTSTSNSTSTAEAGPSTPSISTSTNGATPLNPLPPAASIADLRARLANRLDKFKRDRGEPESRDELEAERRQKRGEMRDRRRKERKEARRKSAAEPTAKGAKTQLIVPQLPRPTSAADSVTYPALSLPSSSNAKQPKAPLKALANPAQALAHLERHNAKLASLPEEKRKEIEEKERWAKAEERARGGKVADEEKVLKKAVKRVEKAKSKSGKEWAERKRDLEKNQAISIKKRNDNIASRAEARKNKRLGIKDKSGGKDKGGKKGGSGGGYKGKKRPGFEGGRNKAK